ncbi:MAG: sulfate adenylyltransferase [Candidatus Omnitrophica bacterium CG11_big_fil_rev_8_21_14_0_20_45_26]|uniref:Sulfate adenylyltransferase n=1 Tax=Candidatus Abzuiibacterium crystallinum TaxID=1974748 RepID=A0A2H0LQJ4_9BACT|nr:MAG: sulfate adenylyltransferase [Candidatus Omnitrophica bacterium CG11_big_fil_rev_8_21_14_0_20_45_26]PIW64225.1 MAG: sulfate adenylyltransferase [Candidatus Omnitrophica bacterium CG12_big_fil_rev_8_21_14_0_65_45_16]
MSLLPHGGKLINRLTEGKEAQAARQQAEKLPAVILSERETCDLEMLATGALSPLEGFMVEADYETCLQKKRLANQLPWTIPITKSISDEEKNKIKKGDTVALQDADGTKLALLSVESIFKHDKKKESEAVYGTSDEAHPGVKHVLKMGGWLVGGKVTVFEKPNHTDFAGYRLDPKQTRALFEEKGWNTVVAFQTRNPIHRAHEYLTKVALECVDGLLIHPLVGQTKGDDISAEVRMKCYQVLLDNYYPKDRTALTVFPAAMRYAGPREAVWHAIVRKNYGCTHFIVGRDHAGANRSDGKSYYGTYDAQLIFNEFKPEEIGIEIFKFEHTFFDKKTGGMVSFKTAPPNAEAFSVSGTKLREMLRHGELPPSEITRPEVAKILIEAMRAEAKSSA